MSTISAMADSLVTALQAAGFTEAERKPVPYQKREECANRKCVVIAPHHEIGDGSRKDDDDTFEIWIVIQKGVANPHDNAEIDPLVDDVQTLWNLWRESGALRNAPLQGAEWMEGPSHKTGTIYELEHLLTRNLFNSITLVKYRIET